MYMKNQIIVRTALLLWSVVCSLAADHEVFVPEMYYRTFAAANPVLKRIRPGEMVTTKTIDASGRDEKGTARSESGNPLTGPFFVEGAEPGDALLVHLKKVRINRPWGFTSSRLGMFALTPESIAALHPMYTARFMPDKVFPGRANTLRWEVDLDRQIVRMVDPKSAVVNLEFPAKPMLGCVGVAPAGDFAPTSIPAGSYGGNLDYNEIGAGVTVMLPVYHPGALLYIGDGHALQGDGEPMGNGIEISMDVQFTTSLKKKANLTGPRIETADYIISIGSQPEFVSSLDRSIKMATSDMGTWLIDEYKLEAWAAHLLIGFQARYDVVTIAGSMALKIPKKHLPQTAK
jgi:acetamidase/formamidase